jgi:transposase
MAYRLKMAEHQSILGLARLNWSYRRIAAELGVDRETVSRHVKAARKGQAVGSPGDPSGAGPPDSNAAIVIAGSAEGEAATAASVVPAAPWVPEANAPILIAGSTEPATADSEGWSCPTAGRRSACEPWRAMIIEGLERGLTARRIWQDLTADHGFVGDYQSVQRFVRNLKEATPLPFRRMECEPGEEAQVDFGRGAPIVAADGKRQHPHLFRIVLSCSRKAYSEAVTRQTTEQFLRCIENAFVYFGGVPKTLVKAGGS